VNGVCLLYAGYGGSLADAGCRSWARAPVARGERLPGTLGDDMIRLMLHSQNSF
jgi:hypothetical protein